MRINIEPVRKKDNANRIILDYTINTVDDESNKQNYITLLGAKEVDFVKISGEILQKNGLVTVFYKIEAKFSAECARCDKDTWQTIEVDGEKYIADKSEKEEKDSGSDFYVTEADGFLEVDDFIVEFLGVEIPYRYLCSDDCKGLCHNCGKDLNEGECSCPKKEKNPAFKILDDFFKE